MDETVMKIGEIAGFFGVSVKAIRIYEKKGILKPAKVDDVSGYRYYTAEQVQQLNALLELKQLGFSLAEIKKLLDGGMSNEQFMEAITHKKAVWQNTIAAAKNKIAAIDQITERLKTANPPTQMHKLSDEDRAWQLAKMVCIADLQGRSIISEAIWL